MKDQKILLGKRTSDPTKSRLHGENTWTCPGGAMHFGESFFDSAQRELEEEIGIKPKKVEVVSITNERVHDAHFVTIGLLCKDFEGEPENKEPDEISEWRWFSFDDLPKPLFIPSQKLIENYLNKRFTGDE